MDNIDKTMLNFYEQYQKIVEQHINKNDIDNIDYEHDFDKISKKNISYRDNSYTELLRHFVHITKVRNKVKEIHKWVYFWIIMLLIILFGFSICSFLARADIKYNNDLNVLLEIITCLISFASVIISIPLIITKYLFSSKEDKRISNIILHTQEHDLSNKKMIKNLVNEKMEGKMQEISSNNSYKDEIAELVNQIYEEAEDSFVIKEE